MFAGLATMLAKAREVRRNAKLSRAELDEVKLAKFRALVAHAQAKAPYYAELIRARGIDVASCTPADFPLLTKSILMDNFDAIVTDRRITKQAVAEFLTRSSDPSELFLDGYRVMHTSGTSGEVGYFLYSPTDWARGAMMGGRRRERQRRTGPRRKRRGGRFRIAFYGATGGHFAGVTMFSAASKGLLRLIARIETFEINTPIAETLGKLNAFQPDVISGYTTALKMLGEQQKAGALHIAPVAIAATGETVTKADMTFLSDAFAGAQVVSAYGCTEHLGLGASNPGGETMTLHDNDLIFEFHEDHSVITNLFNFTMPLIRYRMSDILQPVSGPDDRDLVIKNLVGRTERTPTFVNRDGVTDFISPHTINEIFVAGVRRFQMRLSGADSFRFVICLEPGLGPEEAAAAVAGVEARLGEILAQKGMDTVRFTIEVADDIAVNPRTRKFQLIVDERETG